MPDSDGPGRPHRSQTGMGSVMGGAWRTTDPLGIGPTTSFPTPRYPFLTRTLGPGGAQIEMTILLRTLPDFMRFDGLGHALQGERRVDARRHLTGLDELGHRFEVGVVLLGGEHRQPLTPERRQRDRSQRSAEAASHGASRFAADDDHRAARRERTPQVRERCVPADVEDQGLVALRGLRGRHRCGHFGLDLILDALEASVTR